MLRGKQRFAMIVKPVISSISMTQTIIHLEWAPCSEGAQVGIETAIIVFRMHSFSPTIPEFLFHRAPSEQQPGFVKVIAQCVKARHPNHYRGCISKISKALLTFLQGCL